MNTPFTPSQETQQDHTVRVVALTNLVAMCGRVSGTCHVYSVEKITRSRVWVTYSNPDEYGREQPMSAVFPCYPSAWPGDADNPRVVLDIMRVVNDGWNGEGWQAFTVLMECATLWRDPSGARWSTEMEIKEHQAAEHQR